MVTVLAITADLFATIDPEVAAARNVPVRMGVFAALMGVVAPQAVGALLVMSLLITPPRRPPSREICPGRRDRDLRWSSPRSAVGGILSLAPGSRCRCSWPTLVCDLHGCWLLPAAPLTSRSLSPL